MGFLEDIETMDLSDDVKQKMIASYQGDVDPLKERANNAEKSDRVTRVATEITELSEAGLKDAPKALAYLRRVFLSPDAEVPGAVLLSDAELELSGDEATGARTKEDVSASHVLRTFLSLLPRTQEGKLAMQLSDQGIEAENHGRPDKGEGNESSQETSDKHREGLGKALGRPVDRRSRGKRYGDTVVSGAE